MDLSVLGEIGLSAGEVRVYLALLRLGSTKTGELALKAGVSSSKVYKILGRLEKKGLVGHVVKKGIKHYRALESAKILEYLDQKEKRLAEQKALVESMLPGLEKQRNSSSAPEATVYYGFKAVTGFFENLLQELKPGEGYSIVGVRYAGNIERQSRFFQKFHQRRALKKIRLRMIADHNARKRMVKETFLNSEVRFSPPSFFTQMSVLFYKNKSFIIVWGDDIFGFLIESKPVVESFETYFENFWKVAKR